MSIASEAAAAPSGMEAVLNSGLNALSRNETLVFTQYRKMVVEQDGYVFWVNGGVAVTAKGSLHYGTSRAQDEDQTIGVNAILFTSEQEITAFNAVSAGVMWIANWSMPNGETIQIAFSSRGPLYQEANIWHYAGFAIYPALQAQIIDSESQLPGGPIVSNSVPLWINALANLSTIPGIQSANYVGYNSFLLPENIVPPYIAIHVEPGMTKPVQQFQNYRWSQKTGTGPAYPLPSTQLMRDMVRLTLYGFNNQMAFQLLAGLQEWSLMTEDYGFMNSPAIQDEKRIQSEIAALAMKKTITIDANYYQGAADVIARELILSASISYQINGA